MRLFVLLAVVLSVLAFTYSQDMQIKQIQVASKVKPKKDSDIQNLILARQRGPQRLRANSRTQVRPQVAGQTPGGAGRKSSRPTRRRARLTTARLEGIFRGFGAPALRRALRAGVGRANRERQRNRSFLQRGVDEGKGRRRGSRKLRQANNGADPFVSTNIKKAALAIEAATREVMRSQRLQRSDVASLRFIRKLNLRRIRNRNGKPRRPRRRGRPGVKRPNRNLPRRGRARGRGRGSGRGQGRNGRNNRGRGQSGRKRRETGRSGRQNRNNINKRRGKRQADDAECPFVDPNSIQCDANLQYRSADGSCNNLNQDKQLWGASFVPFSRFGDAAYEDGVSSPRTEAFRFSPSVPPSDLPSARQISTTVHETSAPSNAHRLYTSMVMQWGQFLDHDMTFTPVTTGEDGAEVGCCVDVVSNANQAELDAREGCFKIDIPANDPRFTARTCLNFARSSPSPNLLCELGVREQVNQLTSYIDASNVYGSKKTQEEELRSFVEGENGKLRESTDGRRILPPDTEGAEGCTLPQGRPEVQCFKAGDQRSAEQSALTSMHIAFLREHNRMAEFLYNNNPSWDGDKTYNETRKIMGAIMQRITYKHWLPLVLGPSVMSWYGLQAQDTGRFFGYDPNIDPTVSNVFATAAFRFGHTLLRDQFKRVAKDYSIGGNYRDLILRNSFFQPEHMYNDDTDGVNEGGPSSLIRGLINTTMQSKDRLFTVEVRDHLFQAQNNPMDSLDLIALNIQRGRDHGIASYNTWRVKCGLGEAYHPDPFNGAVIGFYQLYTGDQASGVVATHTLDAVFKLLDAYRETNDIDLFTGAISETPLPGAVVGPTFACILGQQFANVKKGDRFWHETQDSATGFTEDQLQQIRKVTLAHILCDNMDIATLQPDVFRSPTYTGNSRILCQNLPLGIDLTYWLET